MTTTSIKSSSDTKGLDHRTVWRWHFYAGLYCIPFVLWLSIIGTIFLFHPQIQHWLDRPYDHLSTSGAAAPVNAQVQAAIASVPGSSLRAYQLPYTPHSPAQVLVDKQLQEFRVYVDPRTIQILKTDNEDMRIDTFISCLHGELLIGKYGSWIVELAASWAVIMIFTGLFLWWPNSASGLGGILYQRLRQGKRTFCRDIHAVTGIYVSFFALFLLFTGLPWAKSWGTYLKAARALSNGHAVKQDWTTSSADILAARAARTGGDDMSNMPGMRHSDVSQHTSRSSRRAAMAPSGPDAYRAIDKMVATVAPLALTNPVLVSPPMQPGDPWTAKSDTRNRPLRVDLTLDGKTGAILKRTDFQSKPWLDRVIGTGIAAHEGQLFGLANQMLSLFTTIGLVTLSLSGLRMWRLRKPADTLGAPAPIRGSAFPQALSHCWLPLVSIFPS